MNNTQMQKPSIRGWLALICVFMAIVVFNGFIGNQVGLLIEPISTDLGLPRTVYTSIESVTPITNAIISLFFAKIMEKIGLRAMAILGCICAVIYCTCTLLASYFTGAAIPLFICAQVCLGLNMSWVAIMTASITINNWFAKNKGLLISLVSAASAIGGMIAAPLVTNWILTTGWETSMLFRGIASLAVAALFIFMYKSKPGTNECMVWQGQQEIVSEDQTKQVETGLTMAQAKKTINFWACIFVCLGIGMFVYPPFVVLAAFCGDCGFTDIMGTAMSVVFVAQIIATLPMGVLIEKFGVRRVIAPIFAFEALALLLFVISPSELIIYIGAVAIGAGFSCCTAFIPMFASSVFGTRDFAKIQSFLFTSMIVGMVIGPPVFNAVYDSTGAYNIVFIADMIALLAAVVAIFLATKKIKNTCNETAE